MENPILVFGQDAPTREKYALKEALSRSSKFDVFTLPADTESGIEGVRRLTEKISKKPFNSRFTSVLVFEAQNLTLEAQNALLKTLEEGSETSFLVLTCPNPNSVLDTVASRCQKIDLGSPLPKVNSFEFDSTLNLGDYLNLAEKLDIDSWEAFWREKMLANLGTANLAAIVSYLHTIQKAREFLLKRANQKLVKINLIFDIPKID